MTNSNHAVSRYTTTAIVLHWGLGLALVGLFGMGLYMADLPFSFVLSTNARVVGISPIPN